MGVVDGVAPFITGLIGTSFFYGTALFVLSIV